MRQITFALSLVLIFMISWEDMIFLKGLGTAARLMGLLVAGCWSLKIVTTGELRRPHLFHLTMYFFVLWNIASLFWSVDVPLTISRVQTYFQLFILMWIFWDTYTTPKALRAGLHAYVLGLFVSIGSIVWNYLTAREAFYLRYSASGFNPNDIGVMLALGIPIAWYLATAADETHPIFQLLYYGYIPTAIAAIMLTGTRTALIAALPAFIFGIWSLVRLQPFVRILICAVVLGALIAVPLFVPQSSLQRFGTIGGELASPSLTGRVDVWREGIAIFTDHPILGVGGGAFITAAVKNRIIAHNTFLSILAETGLIGFILFLLILVIAVHNALRHPIWDARFWLTVLLVWSLGASALTWEHRKPTWLFLNFVIVSAGLIQSETSFKRHLVQPPRPPWRSLERQSRPTAPVAMQPRKS